MVSESPGRNVSEPCQRQGFGWNRVEQGMAVRNAGTLLGVSRLLRAAQLGSRPSLIDLINLGVNCAGARSAGNPLATCDVAGAGNQLTVWLVRHSQRKRGATDRPDLRSNGASPRPYRAPDGQRNRYRQGLQCCRPG